MCSSKYVDFYAFPFAMRPSGANANAQLILPGEKKFLQRNFNLNYHQKTQRIQSVKQSSFCYYRACSETDFGKSKRENEGNGKKKTVQNKNATSKTYLISANVIIPIRLISDFRRRFYGYGCSLYRSQRDRVSILPRSRITDSCFKFFTKYFFTNACFQFLMRSCINFKKMIF